MWLKELLSIPFWKYFGVLSGVDKMEDVEDCELFKLKKKLEFDTINLCCGTWIKLDNTKYYIYGLMCKV